MNSPFDLKDKVAVVTGGAGGIGTEIAMEYARAGASIILASRNRDSLENVATEISKLGVRALPVVTDITIPEQVDSLISTTIEEFGRVDIMVNNAGGGSSMKNPEDTPYEEWVKLIDFNLTGTFNCCMAAGKQMIKQQDGKIINISSVAGTKGNPGMLHYSAAKAGVISLTNNLAYMWAKHNICVNTVIPGLIATPLMIKYKAIPPDKNEDGSDVPRLDLPPSPKDVAYLCRYLASPAADMITGESIPVRAWCKTDRFWQ